MSPHVYTPVTLARHWWTNGKKNGADTLSERINSNSSTTAPLSSSIPIGHSYLVSTGFGGGGCSRPHVGHRIVVKCAVPHDAHHIARSISTDQGYFGRFSCFGPGSRCAAGRVMATAATTAAISASLIASIAATRHGRQ